MLPETIAFFIILIRPYHIGITFLDRMVETIGRIGYNVRKVIRAKR